MALDPPSHVIYWNGTTYKSVQNLVTRISMEDDNLFLRNGAVNERAVGSIAVYFTDRPAIDLGPIVQEVLEKHSENRPEDGWRYDYSPEGREIAKARRAAIRVDLKAAIEPIVPVPYKGDPHA